MDNGFLKMMQTLSTSASTANYIRTAATTNSLSMESSAIYGDSDEDYQYREGGQRSRRRSSTFGMEDDYFSR